MAGSAEIRQLKSGCPAVADRAVFLMKGNLRDVARTMNAPKNDNNVRTHWIVASVIVRCSASDIRVEDRMSCAATNRLSCVPTSADPGRNVEVMTNAKKPASTKPVFSTCTFVFD